MSTPIPQAHLVTGPSFTASCVCELGHDHTTAETPDDYKAKVVAERRDPNLSSQEPSLSPEIEVEPLP